MAGSHGSVDRLDLSHEPSRSRVRSWLTRLDNTSSPAANGIVVGGPPVGALLVEGQVHETGVLTDE